MRPVTKLLGSTPRVRLLSACLRLAPYSFTAAEAAREAGLQKSSAYRHARKLQRDGLIVPVSNEGPKQYRLNEQLPTIQALTLFEAAVELLADPSSSAEDPEKVIESLRSGLKRTVDFTVLGITTGVAHTGERSFSSLSTVTRMSNEGTT